MPGVLQCRNILFADMIFAVCCAAELFKIPQCSGNLLLFGVFFYSGKHQTARHEHRKTERKYVSKAVFVITFKYLALLFNIGVEIVYTDLIFVDHDRRGGSGTQNIGTNRLDLHHVKPVGAEMVGKIHKSQMIVDNAFIVKIIDLCRFIRVFDGASGQNSNQQNRHDLADKNIDI